MMSSECVFLFLQLSLLQRLHKKKPTHPSSDKGKSRCAELQTLHTVSTGRRNLPKHIQDVLDFKHAVAKVSVNNGT